jgi:ATP-binding cassette subfamily B (MDR/TAP) protein 1
MGSILLPVMQLTKAVTAASGFFKIIDSERIALGGLKDPEVSAHADIEFKDVKFAYPTRSHVQILKRLNITFEKGKTTALVGPSGCGKSTIVGLTERWYQLDNSPVQETTENVDEGGTVIESETTIDVNHKPIQNTGSILVDGHNLNEIDVKWWRTQIGLVQQEPFLFNDTIYGNISLGLIGSQWENETEEVKRDLIKGACKEAFADEFIERLPKVNRYLL